MGEQPEHAPRPWRRSAGSGTMWKGARCPCGWEFRMNGITKRSALVECRRHLREVGQSASRNPTTSTAPSKRNEEGV